MKPIKFNFTEYEEDAINFKDGMNTDYDISNLNQYIDCDNLLISSNGYINRFNNSEIVGNSDGITSEIRGIGKLGTQFLRVRGTNIQELVSGTWTTRATLGGTKKVDIVNFKTSSGSSVKTITVGSNSLERVIISSTTLIINELAGKIIKLPSGESKTVISNTTSEIIVEGLIETIPTSSQTCYVYDTIDCLVLITEGVDVKIWKGGTNFVDVSGWSFTGGIEAHNRVFYFKSTENKVYFSEIWNTEYIPKRNFILVNDIKTSISAISKQDTKIIIYSKDERVDLFGYDSETFEIAPKPYNKGCIAKNSIGNSFTLQFFLSNSGVELLNMLGQNGIADSISLSENIKKIIAGYSQLEKENSMGGVYEDKYFLLIGGDLLIYDFLKSYIFKSRIFTLVKDKNWDFLFSFAGELFFGYNGNTYKFLPKTNTAGYSITGYITTNNKIQKGGLDYKKYYHELRFFINNVYNSIVKIYYSIDDGAFVKCYEQTGKSRILAPIRKTGFKIKIKIEIVFDATSGIEDIKLYDGLLYFKHYGKYGGKNF